VPLSVSDHVNKGMKIMYESKSKHQLEVCLRKAIQMARYEDIAHIQRVMDEKFDYVDHHPTRGGKRMVAKELTYREDRV
jgi:hypothetical protein